jgi:hypothetical protein
MPLTEWSSIAGASKGFLDKPADTAGEMWFDSTRRHWRE